MWNVHETSSKSYGSLLRRMVFRKSYCFKVIVCLLAQRAFGVNSTMHFPWPKGETENEKSFLNFKS